MPILFSTEPEADLSTPVRSPAESGAFSTPLNSLLWWPRTRIRQRAGVGDRQRLLCERDRMTTLDRHDRRTDLDVRHLARSDSERSQ